MSMPLRSEEPTPAGSSAAPSARSSSRIIGFIQAERQLVAPALLMLVMLAVERFGLDHHVPGLGVVLDIAVFAAILYAAFGVVHHAELLAHKYGDPYGTMILTFAAVAVEVIM